MKEQCFLVLENLQFNNKCSFWMHVSVWGDTRFWNVMVPRLLTSVSSGDGNSEEENKNESETTLQRYW